MAIVLEVFRIPFIDLNNQSREKIYPNSRIPQKLKISIQLIYIFSFYSLH